MNKDKIYLNKDNPGNIDDEGSIKRNLKGFNLKLVAAIAICWTLFQLWYASPLPFIFNFGIFIDLPARAIHLAFALTLCFLIYPGKKGGQISKLISLIIFLLFYQLLQLFISLLIMRD